MTKQLKLTIELVPKPLWAVNPRTQMGQSNWDKVRKQVYAEYGYQCGICKAAGRLEAHEIWEYDDNALVQRLAGLIALCPGCHQVKHIGRTGMLAAQGKVDLDEIINHFNSVNGCTRQDFLEHFKVVSELWRSRSAKQGWTGDWGNYQGYMSRATPQPR